MKKIFTTMFAAFLTVIAFADARPAIITVTATDQPQFRVMLDGRTYETNKGAVVIRDIYEGNHDLNVYQVGSRSIFNTSKLIYSTSLRVQAGSEMNIFLDRFGKAKISASFPSMGNTRGRNDDQFDHDKHNGRDNGYDKGNDYYSPIATGMNPEDFWGAQRKMESKAADEKRLKFAKKVVDENYLSTSQVKNLMDLIAFDGYKLDLAEYAYNKVVDKKNFFLLKNALTYDQNKRELDSFIDSCD